MNINNLLSVFQHSTKNTKLNEVLADWPEPESIRSSLLPVHPLPTQNIPAPLLNWVIDVADRMQCPHDFIAVTAVVVAGSIVGTGCAVKPKQNDDWFVVPNLWGGIVGRPGMLKTPAVSEVMQLINQLERTSKECYENAIADYEVDMEIFKADREAIKSAILSSRKQELKNKPSKMDAASLKTGLLQMMEPKKPVWRRYKTNDTTIEKLSELLAENPRGLLLYRDELMGLLSTWEKEGRESDRAFFLEAWNGTGSLTTDRITRGTVHTENLCISIFGTTQPAKLSRYLYQALRGRDNDGLLQRFQLLIYPDDIKNWKLIDRKPDHQAKDRVVKLFNKLSAMDFINEGAKKDESEKFIYFQFDDDSQNLFNEWLIKLETQKLRGDDHPLLLEHLSKYRSLMPSLALIFHLFDIADGHKKIKISYDAVLQAIGWCGYLEKHARRVYGMLNNLTAQAASKLCDKIQEGELSSPFTIRDIYRKEWAMLEEKSVVQKACEELIDSGWIRQECQSYEFGRPKLPFYVINPKIKINSNFEENIF